MHLMVTGNAGVGPMHFLETQCQKLVSIDFNLKNLYNLFEMGNKCSDRPVRILPMRFLELSGSGSNSEMN